MTRSWIVAVALSFACAGPAFAERPPESQDDATHVIVGEVGGVYVSEGREQRDFVVKIYVDKVERGEGVAEGDVFYTECFQRRRNAPRIPAPYGHTSVPKEGEKIRAFVIREGSRSEGIYKDWYVKVK